MAENTNSTDTLMLSAEEEAVSQWRARIEAIVDTFGMPRAMAFLWDMEACGFSGDIEEYCQANQLPVEIEYEVQEAIRRFRESGAVAVSTKDWSKAGREHETSH
jgi:hypothetical protein